MNDACSVKVRILRRDLPKWKQLFVASNPEQIEWVGCKKKVRKTKFSDLGVAVKGRGCRVYLESHEAYLAWAPELTKAFKQGLQFLATYGGGDDDRGTAWDEGRAVYVGQQLKVVTTQYDQVVVCINEHTLKPEVQHMLNVQEYLGAARAFVALERKHNGAHKKPKKESK